MKFEDEQQVEENSLGWCAANPIGELRCEGLATMDGDYADRMDRFVETAKRLEIAGVPYFTTAVTRSQLEIPAPFVRDHGEKMKPKATLRLDGSGSKEWPVLIQICYSARFRVRFCSRWKGFLSDNGLQWGDELIVSLVAMSEFVINMFKKNRNYPPKRAPKSSRYSRSTDTTRSHSSGDALPAHDATGDASTPKKMKQRTLPFNNLSTPPATTSPSPTPSPEMKQERNVSENSLACPVALGPDRTDTAPNFEKEMVAIKRHAEIPGKSFKGAIFFRKRLSDASTGYCGYPRSSQIEIPAGFVRCHGRFLSEDNRVITLEGPKPGTRSQVVCRHGSSNGRVIWRRGWHQFVRRNRLKKGDDLEFTLTAPTRFTVQLTRNRYNYRSTKDLSPTTKKRVTTSNALPLDPVNCTNRSAAVAHFVKTLPATSVSKCTAYPFLVVPTSFWHEVRLPLEVNLQGPNSEEKFPVKCSGDVKVGVTKNLTCGWRAYAHANSLQVGDTLRFTYVSESELFVVDYA